MTECPMIEAGDLGDVDSPSQDGLIADSYITGGDDDGPPFVQLFRYHIVCSVVGTSQNTYQFVSVVAEYTCSGGGSSCESTTGMIISQFDFGCVESSGGGTKWDDLVVSVANDEIRTHPADASFSTTMRSDCTLCLNPPSASLFSKTADTETHCVGEYFFLS